MQILKAETDGQNEQNIESRLSPIGISVRHAPEAQGYRRALLALGAAYARAGNALSDRLQHAHADHEEVADLGASYGWIADRRRLVQSYLEAEPAVMAHAFAHYAQPDQIRSLAEAAADLAGESQSLFSALGLLSYLEQELGWADIGAPVGNA